MRIAATTWKAAARAHHKRSSALLRGSTLSAAGSHPIFNFIFSYLGADRGSLCRWSPGPSAVLVAGMSRAAGEPHLWHGTGVRRLGEDDCSYPVGAARAGAGKAWRRTASLLRRTASRPPNLQCFGLHEWAMLYRPAGAPPLVKFQQDLPLRLSQEELNATVESLRPRCSHNDAFRFFAPEAVPLNTVRPQPSRANADELVQPGCVHATIDLLKQSLALFPHLPAEVVGDALELAIDARLLDMRASPYDLRFAPEQARSDFDLAAVRVETPGGRREYQTAQAELTQRAAPLRMRLLLCYEEALRLLEEPGATGDDEQRPHRVNPG